MNSDYTIREEYSVDIAQKIHDELGSHKSPALKVGGNFKLVEFIEDKIENKKYSLYVALKAARQEGIEVNICFKTVYNYLDDGLFMQITNDNLHEKKDRKKRRYKHIRKAYTHKETSISERPKDADTRANFGHWELDTIFGKQGTLSVLLVMTERSINLEIIRKIENKSQECVVRELDKL